MNILLLGADGQLGWRLRHSMAGMGALTALARVGQDGWCGDLNDAAGLETTVRGLRPDVIVNAAAYTAVDRAETEVDAAYAVNARACEVLAREASSIDAWLLHYSTDYVFDGSGDRPWRETDPPSPLNVYGASKLAGEEAIRRECGRHLILRTSWVFDSRGQNFLKAILKAASSRDQLEVVADQWGAPTSATLLAQVTAGILPGLDPKQAGTYHLAASGETSRHGFAVYGLECAQRLGFPLRATPAQVRPVPTAAMPAAAARPLNSRLDTSRFQQAFAVVLPPWQEGVSHAVAQLGAQAYKEGEGRVPP